MAVELSSEKPADKRESSDGQARPGKSLFGILKHLGPAPSEEDIEEVRREMLANFPRDIRVGPGDDEDPCASP